jgi:hypothetical protein
MAIKAKDSWNQTQRAVERNNLDISIATAGQLYRCMRVALVECVGVPSPTLRVAICYAQVPVDLRR